MLPVASPSIGPRERELVADVLNTNTLSTGRYQALFEQRFAQRIGIGHAMACSNGTSALHLALCALGVKPGDEVIVPDSTFVATANAVRYCQATPVFVDVLKLEWTIDPTLVEEAITPHTVGIIAVHLYGVPAHMRELRAIANRFGLWLLEDAAQALGSAIDRMQAGCWGDLATFSFYGNKVLTTGEGGMVVTNDAVFAARVVHLRGQSQCVDVDRYWHDSVGCNYRLSNLACAIGVAQLEQLDNRIVERRLLESQYREALGDSVEFQRCPANAISNAWMVTVVFRSNAERNNVERRLTQHRIETRHPFVPMTRLPMYGNQAGSRCALRLAERGLTLPTHGGVTRSAVETITRVIQLTQKAA